MTRSTTAKLIALACAAAACVPSAAAGSGPGGAPAAGAGQSVLSARQAVLLGHVVLFRGQMASLPAGSALRIERLDPKLGAWLLAVRTATAADGSFAVRWTADHIGRFTVRAVPDSDSETASGAASDPTTALTIFRPAVATWYGPGFYGHKTACGHRLSRSTVGVAHPTLPCGALVDLYRGGKVVTVPVIDRGPFRAGASWDLTAATARLLGLRVTQRIGAVAVRRTPR